ncbi:YihY family inner membrane protein [Marinobacterium sediminicola]
MLVFLRALARQYQTNQGVLNAAALTYTTLFAVVPLMTVSYSMLAAVPNFRGVGEQVQGWIFENFVPATGMVVQEYLSTFASQAQKLTVIGIVFLVITSIMMMKNIEAAFNRIWRVTEPRKGLSSFLLYWAVLSLGPILIGLGLLLTSYIASLPFISSATEVVGRARLLSLLPPLFSALAFMLLYAAVPNCRVPLRNAAIGGVFAAVLFELAKRGFALFVTQFPSYELIYGAFAAVPMFLVWIFISWTIILLGAELTRLLTVSHVSKYRTHEPHLYTVLAVLQRLWVAQQEGEPVPDRVLLQEIPGLDQGRWDDYVQLLMDAGLIRRTEGGQYLLSRDLSRYTLLQLQREMPWPLPDPLPDREEPWQQELHSRLQMLQRQRGVVLNITLQDLYRRGHIPTLEQIQD